MTPRSLLEQCVTAAGNFKVIRAPARSNGPQHQQPYRTAIGTARRDGARTPTASESRAASITDIYGSRLAAPHSIVDPSIQRLTSVNISARSRSSIIRTQSCSVVGFGKD